uniref:Uncharacterized protein n=1 Tax=Romanomermis culicivorax TaxID=13658 RepID=A0A915IK57_ROMCU
MGVTCQPLQRSRWYLLCPTTRTGVPIGQTKRPAQQNRWRTKWAMERTKVANYCRDWDAATKDTRHHSMGQDDQSWRK